VQVSPGIHVRAVFLAQRVPAVSLIVRENQLGATMSRYLIDQIEVNPRVEILLHSEVRLLRGQDGLESVEVQDLKIGAPRKLAAVRYLSSFGAAPCDTWLRGSLNLDGERFVLIGEVAPLDPAVARPPYWRPAFLGYSRRGRAQRIGKAGSLVSR
jgi:thioredoxin reductase (NADPH)